MQGGESLWQVAEDIAPTTDPRDVVERSGPPERARQRRGQRRPEPRRPGEVQPTDTVGHRPARGVGRDVGLAPARDADGRTPYHGWRVLQSRRPAHPRRPAGSDALRRPADQACPWPSTSTRTRTRSPTTSPRDIVESVARGHPRRQPLPRPRVHGAARRLAGLPRATVSPATTSGPRTARTRSSSRSCRPSAAPAGRCSASRPPTRCTRSSRPGTGTPVDRGPTATPASRSRPRPPSAEIRRARARHRLPLRARTTRPAPRSSLETIAAAYDATDGIVVVDEAYAEFMPDGAADRAHPARGPPAPARLAHHEQGLRVRRRPGRATSPPTRR